MQQAKRNGSWALRPLEMRKMNRFGGRNKQKHCGMAMWIFTEFGDFCNLLPAKKVLLWLLLLIAVLQPSITIANKLESIS